MTFYILTLFPQMFTGVFDQSILKNALEKKALEFKFINIRDFVETKYKSVDDKPYGGGKGMVIHPDIVASALASIPKKPYTILLSASGKKYDQRMAEKLARKKQIALICGHYEGIDARVESLVDSVTSVGDFVLTGGEIAAMAVVDSVTRLLPGVIAKGSLSEESFSQIGNLLEYPQYTRPEVFRGQKVPQVLLSGNHQEIEKWRREQAIARTKKFRPDLLKTK